MTDNTACSKCGGELESSPDCFGGVPFCPKCSRLSDSKAAGLNVKGRASDAKSAQERVIFSSSFGFLIVLAVVTILVYYWQFSAAEHRLLEDVISPARQILRDLAGTLPESSAETLGTIFHDGLREEQRVAILSSARRLADLELSARPAVSDQGEALTAVTLQWRATDPHSGVRRIVTVGMTRPDHQSSWRIDRLVVVDPAIN